MEDDLTLRELRAQFQHMATKADLAEMKGQFQHMATKADLASLETRMLKWNVSIIAVVILTPLVARFI